MNEHPSRSAPAHAPSHVEILDPIDRWLHIAVMASLPLALATGALLQSPALAAVLELNAGALSFWHGGVSTLAAAAWLLHLARVLLRWLEGSGGWELLARPSDFAQLARGAAWGLRLSKTPPRRGRFNYRERLPYTLFLAALPLMVATGIAIGQPGRVHGMLGNAGLMAAATLHAALGLALVGALAWHLFFALFQPGMLWFNLSWATGRLGWARVERVRPDWADEILGRVSEGILPQAQEEDEGASVEQLLAMGNQAARQRKFKQAIHFYEQALVLYPGYAQALFNLGVSLYRSGDRERAEQALSRYLEQDRFGPMSDKANAILERLRAAPKGGGHG